MSNKDLTHVDCGNCPRIGTGCEAGHCLNKAAAAIEASLRRRAEEAGYARGLADAQKHPEVLGLSPHPSPVNRMLLDALQAFVKYADEVGDDSMELDKARAALAAAKGEI